MQLVETVWKDKFYMAFRLCPFMMMIHSYPDMRILDVNDAYERQTGLRRDGVVGKTIFEIGLWTDYKAITRAFEKLKKKGRIHNFEVHYRNKAGQDCNGLASSELFDGPDGQRVLSIVEDISVRRRAEHS
jgi:PAS domain S-box-containing protein